MSNTDTTDGRVTDAPVTPKASPVEVSEAELLAWIHSHSDQLTSVGATEAIRRYLEALGTPEDEINATVAQARRTGVTTFRLPVTVEFPEWAPQAHAQDEVAPHETSRRWPALASLVWSAFVLSLVMLTAAGALFKYSSSSASAITLATYFSWVKVGFVASMVSAVAVVGVELGEFVARRRARRQ